MGLSFGFIQFPEIPSCSKISLILSLSLLSYSQIITMMTMSKTFLLGASAVCLLSVTTNAMYEGEPQTGEGEPHTGEGEPSPDSWESSSSDATEEKHRDVSLTVMFPPGTKVSSFRKHVTSCADTFF